MEQLDTRMWRRKSLGQDDGCKMGAGKRSYEIRATYYCPRVYRSSLGGGGFCQSGPCILTLAGLTPASAVGQELAELRQHLIDMSGSCLAIHPSDRGKWTTPHSSSTRTLLPGSDGSRLGHMTEFQDPRRNIQDFQDTDSLLFMGGALKSHCGGHRHLAGASTSSGIA